MIGRLDYRICPPNKCPILNTKLSGGQILKALLFMFKFMDIKLTKQCLQLRRTVHLVLPLSESPVNTDKTETWSSWNILDTSFPMVDFKLTCRNAFY